MGNCLVTKLKKSVANNNLVGIGEIRFPVRANMLISTSNRPIDVFNDSGVLYGTIPGYSGVNLNTQWGITDDTYIRIKSKYDLGGIYIYSEVGSYSEGPIDMDSLEYCTKITDLTLRNYAKCSSFDFVRDMTLLTTLNLYNSGTNVKGDISALANCLQLETLNVIYCPYITGNISVLNNKSSLKVLQFNGAPLFGDMSKLPQSIIYTSGSDNSNMGWENTRTGNAVPINGGTRLGNYVDAMLINQSTLDWSNVSAGDKVINVTGTRTSASDAAVATLKSAGITITVNGTVL